MKAKRCKQLEQIVESCCSEKFAYLESKIEENSVHIQDNLEKNFSHLKKDLIAAIMHTFKSATDVNQLTTAKIRNRKRKLPTMLQNSD